MIPEIIEEFRKRNNPEYAEKMSAYMRGKFEYFGLKSDQRKDIQKLFFSRMNTEIELENRWKFVRELWEKPQRELLYFAMDWVNSFNPKTLKKEDITEIHFLLTNKSWWDSVDILASNILGKYHLQFPDNQSDWLVDWRLSKNFWLRRSCMIYQLKYRDNTDFDLLKSLIKENVHDKEFFIQKAIGWTLRQYGKFHPKLVVEFVEQENIKGLARREALKLIK